MENAIKLTGVTKNYKTFKLDDVNLCLPSGYIMGLIGENGAGKTTLIKTMLGLIKQDAGRVDFFDDRFNPEDKIYKEHIGVVLDTCSFPEDMTVRNVNRMMASCYSTWSSETFYRYMEKFDLPVDKKVKNLSKGMKMKLSIAQALSHDSKVLILDEATSGLDPVVREETLDILLEFIQNEDHSVLISSHILSDLEKICDYITFIHNGKVLFSASREALLEKYGILKCSREDFEAVDEGAVAAYREGMFGIEALVERDRINPVFHIENASIEDIMVHLIREGKR